MSDGTRRKGWVLTVAGPPRSRGELKVVATLEHKPYQRPLSTTILPSAMEALTIILKAKLIYNHMSIFSDL